jgi:hypothetical protein
MSLLVITLLDLSTASSVLGPNDNFYPRLSICIVFFILEITEDSFRLSKIHSLLLDEKVGANFRHILNSNQKPTPQ